MGMKCLALERARQLACILSGCLWGMCDSPIDQAKQWYDMTTSFFIGYHPLDTEHRFLATRICVPLLQRGNSRTDFLLAVNEILFKFKCFLNLMTEVMDEQEQASLFQSPYPIGISTPKDLLRFMAENISETTMYGCDVPTLSELCGNVLRGTDTRGSFMRFPAPEFLEFQEDGTKKMEPDWYYPVWFKYDQYTENQHQTEDISDVDFPVVPWDLRYKRSFYLIMDMEFLKSFYYIHQQEEIRQQFLAERSGPYLAKEYVILENLKPKECFISWEKWVDHLVVMAGLYQPKTFILPPLHCECH